MEKSELYDLFESGLLRKWKDKADESDDCGFKRAEKELMEELTAELNEKSKKLLTSFVLAFENKMDYLYYNLNIKKFLISELKLEWIYRKRLRNMNHNPLKSISKHTKGYIYFNHFIQLRIISYVV